MINEEEIREKLLKTYAKFFPDRSIEELESTVDEIIKQYGDYPNFLQRVIEKEPTA